MGVVPLVGIVTVAVVDADRNAVLLPGGDEIGQFVVVGHADVIDPAHLLRIDPYGTEPVRPLEIEENALAGPFGREFDVALVPGGSHVFIKTRQPVDMTVGALVADTIVVGDPGQYDAVGQHVVVPR